MAKKGYKNRAKQQLEEWVKSNPQHNKIDDECCPDFSCCHPKLLQPEEIRKVFSVANEDTRMSMLGMFLGAAFSTMGVEEDTVYISGDNSEKILQN